VGILFFCRPYRTDNKLPHLPTIFVLLLDSVFLLSHFFFFLFSANPRYTPLLLGGIYMLLLIVVTGAQVLNCLLLSSNLPPGHNKSAAEQAAAFKAEINLRILQAGAAAMATIQGLTQDSASLTGWRRTHRSGEWKVIALYGPGICSLRYQSFPALFRNPEFFRDLHGHRSGESLAYAGILHSSMSEDISGNFRRFLCKK
jgi:hypothetical protein